MPRASTSPPTLNPTTRQRTGWIDTSEHNNQDLNEHEESSHDADSNASFHDILEDNPEDELEPWVDFMTRATHKADDLLAASGITSWIQAEPDLLEAGKDDCQARRRPLDLACLRLETSNLNPAHRVPETRKTSQEMGRRP